MSKPVVEVRDLIKTFSEHRVLNAISFNIQPGEVVGYVGPNGSGKTTTMRILLGILQADSGFIQIFGHPVKTDFAQIGPRLGAVLDSHCLHPHLTVAETLQFYGQLYGLSKNKRQERVAWVVQEMELQPVLALQTRKLSKGWRQRVAFARSLLHEPELLFLDEPFDGIDTETQRHLRAMVKQLARDNGVAIFLTSHDLHEVEQLADRVNILKQGQIIACDTTENLKQALHRNRVNIYFREQVDEARLHNVLLKAGVNGKVYLLEAGYAAAIELPNSDSADAILTQLITEGIRLREFTPVKTSLEDAYFDVVHEQNNRS